MSDVLQAISRFAGSRPTAPALSDSSTKMTYAELALEIAVRAEVLRRTGARVLAVCADNSPEWVVTDLAARSAGIVVVPIPQFFSRRQKLHALADSGADLVIAREAEAMSLQLDIAANTEPDAGIEGYPAWQRKAEVGAAAIPPGTVKISYTSGTTGQPKGVCVSQTASDAVANSLVEATRSLELAKHLCLLPLPTLLENIAGNDAPLIAGGEVVVPRLAELGWSGGADLDVARMTSLVSRFEPHSMILVPEMLRGLLAAVAQGWTVPESLRFVAVGGGRVSPALLEQAEALGLPVYEGYGLTECASVVALNTPDARRHGSVGKPLRHANVRLSEQGQILVSGPSVGSYVGMKAAGLEHYATGDLGHVDEDGFLYVRGRSRNVFINSYGRNVSPDWVEPEFLRHGVIRQIAIFGEAKPWNVAVIVASPGASASAVEEVIRATNSGLPDYARVGDWLAANEPFSLANGLLTANGRVRRDAVFATYRETIEARYADAAGHRVAG